MTFVNNLQPSAPLAHARLRLAALLTPPLGWLLLLYIGSLTFLLVSAFWHYDSDITFTVTRTFTPENFQQIFNDPIYRTIALGTILIAASVTVTDALIGFPIAFVMAKVASPRMKAVLGVLVLMPLWTNYLVKILAWRLILSQGGVLNWLLQPLHLSGPGFGDVAVYMVLSYAWLPFMILPLAAGFERVPNSLLEASSDLGAHTWATFRRVIFPLILPALAAGRSSRSR